jgi:hypothetical protein
MGYVYDRRDLSGMFISVGGNPVSSVHSMVRAFRLARILSHESSQGRGMVS